LIPDRKRVQSLLTRRGRQTHGRIVVEGVRLVEDALRAQVGVDWLYYVPDAAEGRLSKLVDEARDRGIRTVEVTSTELRSVTETETPQGIAVVVVIPEWNWESLADHSSGDILILDGVRDPGNVGTLLRSAEAAGARGVLAVRGTVELANPKVVRASMGAFFRLPSIGVTDASEVHNLCSRLGMPVVTTDVNAGESLASLADTHAVGLVLGGEADGAGDIWKEVGIKSIHIPMHGAVESLNVAAAGAILLFRRVWASQTNS
jgi:RNA methyltransferase, TrmH family